MADEVDESERRELVHFTAEQTRRLLNLLDVVEQLERFSDKEKVALALVIADSAEVHAIVSARQFWRHARGKVKWLGVQITAAVAFFAAASELYSRWRGHP